MQTDVRTFERKGDQRGLLVAIESNRQVPFEIRRVYYIFDTGEGVVRGRHAHRKLQQMLICVHGSCTIVVDDGNERCRVFLDSPDRGLVVGPMLWHEMQDFSADCVLLVLASDVYEESDYIRDYSMFLEMVAGGIEETTESGPVNHVADLPLDAGTTRPNNDF